MTEVFLYRIQDCAIQQLPHLLECVSPERRNKVLRLKRQNKQLQSLFGELVTRAVLNNRFDLENDISDLSRSEHGKPFLKDHPNIHFNISHTEGMVVVAISDSSVGVDIEAIRQVDEKLCGRYFSDSEKEFTGVGTDGWLERFFIVWTGKEAWLKRTGDGLSIPLRSFSTRDESVLKQIQTTVLNGCVVSVSSRGCERAVFIDQDVTARLVDSFVRSKIDVDRQKSDAIS